MLSRLTSHCNPAIIGLTLALVISVFVALPTQAQTQTTATDTREFNIPAGSLDQVLKQFGLQADLKLYLDASLLSKGLTSNGLHGSYSPLHGLHTLLSGAGLVAIQQADGAYRVGTNAALQQDITTANEIQLDKIDIIDNTFIYSRDDKGHNDVYDKDISTSYIGKTEVERYKGSNPADLLNGVAGVFSGDARNSGSLDPNIRGIQGPGRVPLTIDGTEQAITVWRGYNGASNRSYIDPNLIGGIQILKGPSLERNVYTGIGGAIVAKTIDVNDIVKADEDFGAELKLESSSGSVSPRVPELSTGKDYRDVPGFGPGVLHGLSDPSLRVTPKQRDDDNLLSGDDYAYRLAVGKRHDYFDAMLAYAYRKKGNHFSGKNNAGYYSYLRDIDNGKTAADFNPIRDLALDFIPGNEVMNTSSEMASWLGKLTLKISDDQKLQFTIRDTHSLYGEILPSRIRGFGGGRTQARNPGEIQWPLSQVHAKAYNIEYNWKPENNRLIDFYSNIWFTDTRSDTYTAGGTPNYAHNPSQFPDNPYIINTAIRGQDNDRTGVTLSNKMALLQSLDLTLGGNWQYEKLRSDRGFVDPNNPAWNGSWSLPRAGRRQEWEGNFNFAWRPVSRLTINAGARYSSYWAFDDYLAEQQQAGNIATTATAYKGRVVSGFTSYTPTQDDWQKNYDERYAFLISEGASESLADKFAKRFADRESPVGGVIQLEQVTVWYHDGKGNYNEANNPCKNGQLTGVDDCEVYGEESAQGSKEVKAKREELTYTVDTSAETKRGHAWTPFVSATVNVSDNSRVYFRYSEAKRYPSMFESTIGFSASQNIYYDLEPEHTYNYELAYIQELSNWVDADYADIKLAYFHHQTKNVIERNDKWRFSNIEQQTIRGAEMQARIDTGAFFADMALVYIIENRVCDAGSAQRASERQKKGMAGLVIPRCVQDGFLGGYLLTQAIPKLSANLSLGGRFLNKKLELGSRFTYHKQHSNPYLEEYAEFYETFGTNTPFTWDDLLTFDAYLSYQANDAVAVELTGTNLTDQFYVDPATRSVVAAPGRVLKLSVAMRF